MSAGSTWLARHGHALISSVGHMSRTPLATSLTVVVMALALALPLGLLILVSGARSATGDLSGAVGMSVYLQSDVSEEKAQQLARTARGRAGVARVELVSASEGLAEFRKESGFGAALDALEANPLPHVLAITPAPGNSSPSEVEALRAYLAAWPEVESVQLDTEWVTRFNAILEVLRRVLVIAALLLGTGVIAVVGNTIRLEILNRRAEIEVTKLVGGTNAFVRRPFLYSGALYGFWAGLLAWCVVLVALWAIRGPAGALARAYGSSFVVAAPTLGELGDLLAIASFLGWVGSWVATSHHLARIEPGN